MFQNWIQMDIAGHMRTSSSTITQANHAQLRIKGNSKRPIIKTLWDGAHQIKTGSQVNDRSVKRECTKASTN